jgi:ABC-type nitrate/sulfonate/bicarbonate transport system substrate-binding protein
VSVTRFTIGVATPAGMGPAYAYLTPALALGYDRAEGLAFDFFAGGEPASTARGLCAGACTIACLNTIVGFMGRDEGLPMLAIGSKARRAHRYFAVAPGSPIAALPDLRGKRIACDFPHLQSLADAALADEGVEAGSYRWVSWRGSGMEAERMIEPLRRGEVDALFLMDWNDGGFVAAGLPLRHLRSRLLERIRVSSCYWTTEATFASGADVLARGLRAIQKSIVFSFASPGAALETMWQTHPGTRPAGAGQEAAVRRDLEVLKACLEPMRIDAGDPDPRWCAIPPAEMRAWQTFLREVGTLRRDLDVTRCYSTALVERANDFDAAAVRATAERTRFA